MVRKRDLTDEEKEIWKLELEHAKPLKHKPRKPSATKLKPTIRQTPRTIYYSQPAAEFDAKLDLHGMTAANAHSALVKFIHKQAKLGSRKLLVITGKGSGVLREALPQWLSVPALQKSVRVVQPAKQSHGGDGAYYVFLRRSRD